MKVFIAGVMQGNKKNDRIHNQNYRKEIVKALGYLTDNLEIIGTSINSSDRSKLTDKQASEIFFNSCFAVRKADVVIVYVPEASMGTAVEMWEAWKNNVPIITISQLKYNWVIKLLSTKLYSTIAELSQGIKAGDLQIIIKRKRNQ